MPASNQIVKKQLVTLTQHNLIKQIIFRSKLSLSKVQFLQKMKLRNYPKISKLINLYLEIALYHYGMAKDK